MKKRKYIALFCSLFLLILFIGLFIIYHTPISYTGDTTAVYEDGTQVPMQYDLKVQKFFFKPTEITGTITLDGKPYADKYITEAKYFSEGALTISEETSFWAQWKAKREGSTNIFYANDADPAALEQVRKAILPQMQTFEPEAAEIINNKLTFSEKSGRLLGVKWWIEQVIMNEDGTFSCPGSMQNFEAELK